MKSAKATFSTSLDVRAPRPAETGEISVVFKVSLQAVFDAQGYAGGGGVGREVKRGGGGVWGGRVGEGLR